MIQITGLTKWYGKKNALDNLTATIGKGEVVGLVGPNGSGKSTTIKILSTLLFPSAGRVTIFGLDVVHEAIDVKRIIGYVPERAVIWEDLNAFENLYYWGKIMGLNKKDLLPRIETLLKGLSLNQENRQVSKYSKGMRQRVAIAMALIHSPEVVLLDEPASGLDPDGRLLLRELIRNLANDNKIIILSTHELLEANKVCSKVLFIRNGKLMGIGNPREEDMEVKYRELMN